MALNWSLAEISTRVADSRLRAQTFIEEAQARHDPSLNAYKTWSPEFALRQAAAADAEGA
jgi:aspartyl-tRNA(Asn)/glutamyl-tRNA(Gln) amidotransferase subunit A